MGTSTTPSPFIDNLPHTQTQLGAFQYIHPRERGEKTGHLPLMIWGRWSDWSSFGGVYVGVFDAQRWVGDLFYTCIAPIEFRQRCQHRRKPISNVALHKEKSTCHRSKTPWNFLLKYFDEWVYVGSFSSYRWTHQQIRCFRACFEGQTAIQKALKGGLYPGLVSNVLVKPLNHFKDVKIFVCHAVSQSGDISLVKGTKEQCRLADVFPMLRPHFCVLTRKGYGDCMPKKIVCSK